MFLVILERKGGGERRSDVRNMDLLPPICTPTGNQTIMCPDQELNSQPLGVRDDTPSKWGAQPRLLFQYFYINM